MKGQNYWCGHRTNPLKYTSPADYSLHYKKEKTSVFNKTVSYESLIVSKTEYRTLIVKSQDGNTFRWNRYHIRSTGESFNLSMDPDTNVPHHANIIEELTREALPTLTYSTTSVPTMDEEVPPSRHIPITPTKRPYITRSGWICEPKQIIDM